MEPILIGATILGAMVGFAGVFIRLMSWRNGRALRELIAQESKMVRDLIAQESNATRELISKLGELIVAESAGLRQILERMDSKLDSIYSQVAKG